jgi:aminopeptidase N
MKYIILLALILSPALLTAHTQCSRSSDKQQVQAFPDLPYRPYNVLSYDLKLDLRPAFRDKVPQYDAMMTMTVELLESTPRIELDASGMTITGLVINDINQDPKPQPTSDERLIINVPFDMRSAGTILKIVISYYRTSAENNGAHFYPKGMFVGLGPKPAEDSVFVEEDVFYTMSEPRVAHFWMPCNDRPDDKADVSMRITVPAGITAVANGILSDSTTIGNHTIFSFVSDKPMPPYLMVVNASRFAAYDEKVARTADPLDSIRLHYYVWQTDYDEKTITDGSKYNATYSFKNTKWMMKAFEEKFGPYPFHQYGQVAVQPFNYGGMEHQTLSTVNRAWMRGRSESGIAHELGHQWFGDKVTCETFKDIWLNEGFATYTEAIYNESWGGDQWYRLTIESKARDYFRGENNHIPIYDPPEYLVFNGATTYAKGACVIHMLRRMVNDDNKFFGTLRDYTDQFAYGNCNTAQFRDFLSEKLQMDLSTYFDQWVFGPKHPVYNITWAQDASTKELFLRVEQTQDEREVFSMPLRFFAYHSNGIDTINVGNDHRIQRYRTLRSNTIDSIKFDNDLVILSEVSISYDALLDVTTSSTVSGFMVRFDALQNIVECKLPESESSAVLYSIAGIPLQHIQHHQGVIRFDVSNFANGVYIVRSGRQSAKVVIVR